MPSREHLRVSEMIITPIACPDPPLLNHHGVHEPMYRRVIVQLADRGWPGRVG